MVHYVGEIDHDFVALVLGWVEVRGWVVGDVDGALPVWEFLCDPACVFFFGAGDYHCLCVFVARGFGRAWDEVWWGRVEVV